MITGVEHLVEAVFDIEDIIEEVADPEDLTDDFISNPLIILFAFMPTLLALFPFVLFVITLVWYRQFRETVLMFAISNIEPLCESL